MAPEEPNRPLTREELYELVWSTPVQHVARRYGLSDRGLAKLCAREAVPVPPRGYWAKLRAGKPVKRVALPAVLRPAGQGRIAVAKEPTVVEPEPVPLPMFSGELASLLAQVNAGPLPEVRTDLADAHPAVRVAAQGLRERSRRKRDSWDPSVGWNDPKRAPGFSDENRGAMLLLLDAFARHAEAHGIVISPSAHRGIAVQGQLAGVAFHVSIHESPVRPYQREHGATWRLTPAARGQPAVRLRRPRQCVRGVRTDVSRLQTNSSWESCRVEDTRESRRSVATCALHATCVGRGERI